MNSHDLAYLTLSADRADTAAKRRAKGAKATKANVAKAIAQNLPPAVATREFLDGLGYVHTFARDVRELLRAGALQPSAITSRVFDDVQTARRKVRATWVIETYKWIVRACVRSGCTVTQPNGQEIPGLPFMILEDAISLGDTIKFSFRLPNGEYFTLSGNAEQLIVLEGFNGIYAKEAREAVRVWLCDMTQQLNKYTAEF